MALPTIIFNNGAGHDSQASGAGPTSALTGSDASYSGSVVTVPNANLTDVLTDGSHVIFLITSTGRKFFKITNKASSGTSSANVTVANAPSGTTTGLTYAIGGKRKTVDETNSRLLFSADLLGGWTVVCEDDQPPVTASIDCVTVGDSAGDITFKGDSESNHRLLTSATNNVAILAGGFNGWNVQNFKITSTAATKTTSYGIIIYTAAGLLKIRNCIFGDATNKLQSAIARSGGQGTLDMKDCEISNCISTGIAGYSGTSGGSCDIDNCWIHDCGGDGVAPEFMSPSGRLIVTRCLIEGNVGIGVSVTNLFQTTRVEGCTIHGNGSDGIRLAANAVAGAVILNNQLTGSTGGFGLNCSSGSTEFNDSVISIANHNNYGTGGMANVSGPRNNISAGLNDTTVDPGYVGVGSNNFTLSASTPSGYPLSTRNVGANQSGTKSFVDIGASQRQETGSNIIIIKTKKM